MYYWGISQKCFNLLNRCVRVLDQLEGCLADFQFLILLNADSWLALLTVQHLSEFHITPAPTTSCPSCLQDLALTLTLMRTEDVQGERKYWSKGWKKKVIWWFTYAASHGRQFIEERPPIALCLLCHWQKQIWYISLSQKRTSCTKGTESCLTFADPWHWKYFHKYVCHDYFCQLIFIPTVRVSNAFSSAVKPQRVYCGAWSTVIIHTITFCFTNHSEAFKPFWLTSFNSLA